MTFYKEFGQLNVQMINKVPYKAKSKLNQRLTSRCSSALNLLDGDGGRVDLLRLRPQQQLRAGGVTV